MSAFDLYRGQGLPEGTKSLAFSLVFRAPDRTLTDEEVSAAFQKIQEQMAKTTPVYDPEITHAHALRL